MPSLTGIGIKVGGKIVEAAFGKGLAKKAMAVSTKNAAKKKEAKVAVKAAAKKKPLTTPKSGVKVKSTGKPSSEPFSRMKPSRPVSPIIGKPGFKKPIKINTDPTKKKSK